MPVFQRDLILQEALVGEFQNAFVPSSPLHVSRKLVVDLQDLTQDVVAVDLDVVVAVADLDIGHRVVDLDLAGHRVGVVDLDLGHRVGVVDEVK